MKSTLIISLFLFSCSSILESDLQSLNISQSVQGERYNIVQPFPHLLNVSGEFFFTYQLGQKLEYRLLLNWTAVGLLYKNGVQQPSPWSYVMYTIYAYVDNDVIWRATLTPISGKRSKIPHSMDGYGFKAGDDIHIMWMVESWMVRECEFKEAVMLGSVK